MMKAIFLIMVLMSLACFAEVQPEAAPQNKKKPSQPKPSNSETLKPPAPAQPALSSETALDREARQKMEEHLLKTFTKKGDSYLSGFSDSEYRYIDKLLEQKNLTYKIHKGQLDEADRLNGIEWQGAYEVNSSVFRNAERNEEGVWVWTEWQTGTCSCYPWQRRLEKKNGQWRWDTDYYSYTYVTSIDCPEILEPAQNLINGTWELRWDAGKYLAKATFQGVSGKVSVRFQAPDGKTVTLEQDARLTFENTRVNVLCSNPIYADTKKAVSDYRRDYFAIYWGCLDGKLKFVGGYYGKPSQPEGMEILSHQP